MWREIGLFGRDKFLKKEIMPRILGKKSAFVLIGKQGVGKSAVLEWAYEQAPEPKALISSSQTISEILKSVAAQWNLSLEADGKEVLIEKAKREQLETAISQMDGNAKIFVDDFHKTTPTKLQKIKVWNDKFTMFYAGENHFRNEVMKHCLVGKVPLHINRLDGDARMKMAQAICTQVGSKNSPSEIALNCDGVPSKIIAMAKGTVTQVHRFEGEELDTAFVYLFAIMSLVLLRVIGRGIQDTALYLIGMIAMIGGMMVRMYISKGMRK